MRIKLQNTNLQRVEKMLNRLDAIDKGMMEYVPDDYPVLINTVERFYKGIALELSYLYPKDKDLKNVLRVTRDHHQINPLLLPIHKRIKLAKNSKEFKKLDERMLTLSIRYTPSRFNREFTFCEFQKDYELFQKQYVRVIKGLNKLKNTDKLQSYGQLISGQYQEERE